MVKVGEVIEVQSKAGNLVKRKCIAVVAPEYLAEQREIVKANGFAPAFVKDGIVWLAMSPAKRNKLDPKVKAQREADKQKTHTDYVARCKKSALAKKAKADKRLAELE